MADCNYRFRDTAGAWQTITGKPAMMAALVSGRMDHLLSSDAVAAMAAPSAAAPKSAQTPRTPPAPAPNTIFTEDAAAKARELLRRKLGQLNSGLDPEMLQAGITLAGYHIEKGARSFSAYAQAMLADLGDAVRPYLKSWYMGVKYDPRAAGFEGMDTATTVEAADTNAVSTSLRESLYRAIKAGNMPKDNPALRKIAQDADGAIPTAARMKEAQEDLEAAIVMASRDVVAKKEGDRTTFDILLRLYESQPNLNIRTSTSIDNQAYSTPAPLAFLTARLAGIGKDTTMYEPTAGNGMLAITATPRNVTATELDGQRFGNLQALGVNVTQGDALKAEVPPKSVDAVHTNPPFGPIKNEKGESIKVKFDGYTLGQIDHLIAARALDAMKDDGKASLIIGANKAQGQMSNNDLIFFNWLYGNYNVTTHFEVSGDLYQRQGAGWPVRVITINGRAKSDQTAPAPGSIARAGNWSEVYEQFQKGMDSGRGAAGGRNGAIGGAPAAADDARAVSVFAGTEAGQPDSGRPASRPQRAGNVAGAGPRAVGDRGAVPGEPVGQRDRGQRPDGDAAGADGRAGAAEAAGTPAKPAGSPRTTGVKAEENQFQSTYVARSARKDEGVLIPVNMAGPTQDALNRLEDEVGDIDEFVVKELGYPSIDALHDAFMGLQVDSIASAVYQIKAGKGIIIADQTGIGKGRQAAGIIRWAAKNGKIPVFVTVKPSLFTDMYGDLADIGTSDVDPFILNSNAWIKGPGDEKLFANRATLHKAAIERIATTGELPSGRNALFLTYSQINTDNVQRRAVMALAPNAVFVLDESHNAGGDSGTGAFVRDALGLAAGVTYLSATYAKRPDNMPVYFKTDIGDASADDDSLMSAMSAGGLPLQTVVANNLVKAGQMFRRERSYDGVSIESRADTAHRAEHVELSDSTTLALRAIVKADSTFHSNYVKALQKELEKQGSRVMDMAGNQAKASVDHTQFSSVVHNFVRQMLLGLKAQESADEAVRSLRRGEKPLIAVENTMGSFLAEYAENNNLRPGDSLGSFDYRTVLSRALERSRYIIRQLPNGDKVKEYIPLNKLDPISRAAYESAQGVIDELEISIPVSPIDWMRNEITKAGFSVAEVTGRNLSVDYSDPNNPKLAQIDPVEQKDKVRTTRLFNSGQLDALVLNVAGSTGISLHASEKFKDQRQRHMIVAQAAQDINIFMQMLGRIHRTGQVRLPKYTILTADLPAEIRPTALLSGKMKSLNANTSSNTKSATSVESADMLNKYGDQVVGQYLADNPELARALGVDAADDDEGPGEDIARKATGRLALMPVKVQEQFYAEVEEQYRALIDYLNKTNQNDLEPRTFDLDARELKSELLFEGRNKASPFGEDAFYNEFSIKAQGKAMTPDEIRAAMNENLGGLTSDDHARTLIASLKQAWVDGIENAKDDNGIGDVFDEAKFRSSLEAKKLSDSYIEAMVAANRDAYARGEKRRPMTVADVPGFGEIATKGVDFVRTHPIGSMFRVEINGDNYNAVVTNIRSTHKASGNPFSMSKFQVTIALNGALRSLTVPATQFSKIETSYLYGSSANIDALFRPGPTNERETAKIITGNLLGAYGEISESRGSIITFTKADGSTEQGILMPKAFSFAKDVRNDYRIKTPEDALNFLTNSKSENTRKFGISSRDGIVRVLPEGARGIAIQVPKSKAKGGRFFLDARLREHAGDFVSVGNSMFAYIEDAGKARMALDVLMQKQALYALPSMSEEARTIIGDAKPAATIAPQATPSAPAAPATSGAVVEHTTQNGKVLRGIVRTDLTKAEAQEIDPYTFKKDGGWFIREKHVKSGDAAPKFSRASNPLPNTITIDGVDRPTTNSTGKPIHPNEDGVRAFYRWFGDSKAMDKQGRPLAVYHGTTADIDGEFKPGSAAWDDGIFFTASPEVAGSVYAQGQSVPNIEGIRAALSGMSDERVEALAERLRSRSRAFDFWPEDYGPGDGVPFSQQLADYIRDTFDEFEDGASSALSVTAEELGVPSKSAANGSNVLAAYLRLRNPLEIDGSNEEFDRSQQAEWIARAKKGGHDGLILRDYEDGGFGGPDNYKSAGRHDVYVAFQPDQIKSAIGNVGTFDPSSPDIRRSAAVPSSASGITAESLPAAFAQRFPSLSGAIKTMLDRGALGQKGGLVVLETNDETQIAREFADRTGRTFDETVQMFESGVGPEINGFYDALSGTTFLVGPNLDGDAASAVVMHEMVHGQQRRSLDEKSLALIQGRAKLPLPLGKFLTRVAQRMEDVGESNNATEAAAYIVELAVQEGRQAGFSAADGPILAWIEKNIGKPVADLVREFVAMARAWALSHGVNLKRIAVDDLVAYAKLGLKRAADGRVVTFGRESGNIAAMSERQGVAGKQAPTPSNSPDVKFSRAAQAALGPLSAAQQSTVERIFGKPKTLRERAEAFAKDWQKNLVQGIFDQFAPIKELTSKGYMLTRLAKGSDSTLEAMLVYGKVSVDSDGVYKVDFDGKNLNGFAKTMAKLDGEHDRFLAWVSGQRAERLSQVGLENLMTPADIAALQSLADGNTKSGKVRRALYADALKDLNAFNDSVLKIASDSGLIDEATREMYRDVPYVPFYRLSEEDVVQGPSVSKGLVNQSAWKRLKGGTNQLNEDLMGNLLKNWSHLITASANNRAAKEVLDTAARMGAATDMTNDVVAQDINGQPIYRGNTKGLVRYRGEIKRKIPKGQPYIENGQTLISDGTAEISYVGDRYFKVDDPHLMDAIGSIGFTTKVWKPMADFKRYLTFGVTVNPTFKVRNLIRDSIQAVGTAELSYNPVQNILMGAKGTAMMSNVRAQMLASGGMLRFGSAEGGYSGHVRRLIEKGVDPQYILDDDNKIKSFWKHKVLPAFEAYQELGDRSENVNRAALYEQLLTKGMSHAEASFWARDMMDFSMHGKWAAIRTLTAVVPFMNARLQGIYKLGRATKADYRRMGTTLAAVSVASMALMLAYGDDDDWKKREDWDRDNSWWFKVGGVAFRIPKPFEVGAVGTIAERSLELLISDEMTGKRFGQRMRDLLMHNLSMNPTPQLIKPMIDLYANKDGFSGREIETQGMEKLRPEDRYTNRTSEVARFLGQIGLPNPAQLLMGRVEGLSPVQIDHLIRGYFSWVGTSATTMLDYGIRPMMDRGDRPDMRLKDVFLAGNFVESLPSGSSRYVTQLYEQAKEIEQMYASYQQAIKEGNTEKAQEIRADNAEGFAARRRIESAKRAQSLISGQMRTIERSKEMSGDEKRARLDQLEKQRDRLARQALLVPAASGRD